MIATKRSTGRDARYMGPRYRVLLDKLDLSITGAARFLDRDERASRRWASGTAPVPAEVAMLLTLMVETGWPPDAVRKLWRDGDIG